MLIIASQMALRAWSAIVGAGARSTRHRTTDYSESSRPNFPDNTGRPAGHKMPGVHKPRQRHGAVDCGPMSTQGAPRLDRSRNRYRTVQMTSSAGASQNPSKSGATTAARQTAADAPRLLFLPVSGPYGMGEYARSLEIAHCRGEMLAGGTHPLCTQP